MKNILLQENNTTTKHLNKMKQDYKFDLYEQFTPLERANLFLNKYSFDYIRFVINGMIKQTRKNNEAYACNYWNEVATEIKKLKQ